MAGIEKPAREFRVVASRIELDDVAGRVLFPSLLQGPWLPFLRFAETSTTGDDADAEGHSHYEEEVLNYILAGRVDYEDETGQHSVLEPGTVEFLTAREATRHKLRVPKQGFQTRWLSVVVQFPRGSPGPTHPIQVAPGPMRYRASEATIERFLVGPEALVASGAGLECIDIEFRKDGRCVCPLGRERRAVAYMFEGSGSVNDQLVEMGAGALFDNVTKVSIQAKSGTRLLLASAPHWVP
ncbi:MAG: pirin family protein [Thermoplasmata archaeon]|nr:pirin family protein [Thermoplasmata archaeon]